MLGRGGFGKVMLAKLRNREQYVAVKYIEKTKETDYNSLVTEAQVLQISRECRFLCQGYAAFQTQRHAFYVMEYLSGGSLEHALEEYGRIDISTIQFLSAEMICGLQFLHSKGIIHRDIKPINILLDDKGHVRISDFGLAKQNVFKDDTITDLVGTLRYMAPEILQEKPYNAAVNWWSLGVTIFEMATGVALFANNDSEELVDSIIMDRPVIPQWLDEELKDLLIKLGSNSGIELLRKKPRRRFGLRGNFRCHPFYESIDWVALEEGAKSPFQPSEPSAKLFFTYDGNLPFLRSEEDEATSGDNNIVSGFSFLSSSWLE
ncbi:hypothetical protein XELAEV_18037146mg [Xenopus laevis]|uniref:Protein kinase domain-containing protein n=1 Tax=Xenopus laevis TaxID=8355 RepID=A0A974CBH2_XENLA|nr:hypothetical protein XELAEV_18037146mg [Xenopus laevis]